MANLFAFSKFCRGDPNSALLITGAVGNFLLKFVNNLHEGRATPNECGLR